jgi:hypothetical protein
MVLIKKIVKGGTISRKINGGSFINNNINNINIKPVESVKKDYIHKNRPKSPPVKNRPKSQLKSI